MDMNLLASKLSYLTDHNSGHATPSTTVMTSTFEDSRMDDYMMFRVNELYKTIKKLESQLEGEVERGRQRDNELESLRKHATKTQLWSAGQRKLDAQREDAALELRKQLEEASRETPALGVKVITPTMEAKLEALDRLLSDHDQLQERCAHLEELLRASNAKSRSSGVTAARTMSKIEALDEMLINHERLEDRVLKAESKINVMQRDMEANGKSTMELMDEQSKHLVSRIKLSSITDQIVALHFLKMPPAARDDIQSKLATKQKRMLQTLQESVDAKGVDKNLLSGLVHLRAFDCGSTKEDLIDGSLTSVPSAKKLGFGSLLFSSKNRSRSRDARSPSQDHFEV